MKMDVKPVGVFDLMFLSSEKIQDPKATEQKYRLNFACSLYIPKADRVLSASESATLFGGLWRTKIGTEQMRKYMDVLEPQRLYRVQAAIDSYAIGGDNRSGDQHGTWFSILDLQPISSRPPAPPAAANVPANSAVPAGAPK